MGILLESYYHDIGRKAVGYIVFVFLKFLKFIFRDYLSWNFFEKQLPTCIIEINFSYKMN